MRLIFLFVSSCILGLSLLAQTPETIKIERGGSYPLEEILEMAEKTGFRLIYSPSLLPTKQVSIPSGRYSIDDLLNFYIPLGLTFEYNQSSIILKFSNVGNRMISGYVLDKETGESMIGATVSLAYSDIGTTTNNYGYFSIAAPRNEEVVLQIRYIGYLQLLDTITPESKTPLRKYNLDPSYEELAAVRITAMDINRNINSMIPGEHRIVTSENHPIPYFLGEVDVIQKSMTFPGIRTLGEDAAGLNVRGGSIDQNLLLLDEALVYNPNHFYGLISVFNPEAVNHALIMKGYIPPQYGGRTSSVIAIHQREGNKYERSVTGGIGLVSARLMTEGPIRRGRSSYLVSARQSLYDISSETFRGNVFDNSRTSFQDLNVKLNWTGNEKNTFFLSGYYGNDQNRAGFDAVRRWGNRTATARWNHTFNRKHFSNYSFVISDYNYRIINPIEAGSFIGSSDIQNYSLKLNHEYRLKSNNQIDFGGQFTFHRLRPGERIPFDENSSLTEEVSLDTEHALETGIYINHQIKPLPKMTIAYGMRLSNLITFGPGELYEYSKTEPQSTESIIDTIYFSEGEITDSFWVPEPRISIKYDLKNQDALKLAYSKTSQFIQLISNTAIPAPTDIWKLSGRHIDPIIAHHISLGYYKNIGSTWEGSIETYFKRLDNVLDYKDGAELLLNASVETEILTGQGRAYGLETLLRKKEGLIQGWASYTLSRSERKFSSPFQSERINDGNYFPDNHDKTHDLSIVLIYPRSQQLSISSTWNYSTGRPITFPSGKYEIGGLIIPYFDQRNRDRISDYHRLDLSVKWSPEATWLYNKLPLKKYFWTFSVFNVYARENAYSYFFRQSEDNPETTEVVRYSIFGTIIPSITLNFQF